MKISQRLFLGVIPSLVGLFTVASLAYWGQYAHTAPQLVVWSTAAATVLSLAVAWWNTRYVAHRVERLASRAGDQRADELDVIEQRVESLGEEASAAKADAARAAEDAGRRTTEYATLLAEAATAVSKQPAGGTVTARPAGQSFRGSQRQPGGDDRRRARGYRGSRS